MSGARTATRISDVVVVGGGVAGCTITYELARYGLRVTLLERFTIAHAASGRNLGALLNQVEPQAVRLMRSSLAIYREVEKASAFQLRELDQLLLARTEAQLLLTRSRAEALRGLGLRVEVAAADELRREFPPLGRDTLGGTVVRGAHLLDPAAATRAFAQAARELGAGFQSGTWVTKVAADGVLSDSGRTPADAVVVAAGPWLGDLLPGLPVSAGRGWCLRTGRLPVAAPWIVEELSWPDTEEVARGARAPTLAEVAAGRHDEPAAEAFVLAPRPDGSALLGTSLAPSLREALEGADMPRRVAGRALEAAPGLREVPVRAAWSGLRPLTPDGLPLVGPAGDGIWVHGGHGSIGMQAAPATARLLAAVMVGEASAGALERLAPGRFSGPAAGPAAWSGAL